MELKQGLLEQLKRYGETDFYPYHMPGHKRQVTETFAKAFPNPFLIDITEIEGFDNLHHPEGILKESMEWAASLYGADKTYYLVNGSSAGILSAICGTTNNSDTILMSRNSHKSAYHGVFLNHLRANYIYPQTLDNFGVQGGLLPDEIEGMLKTHVDIRAVFVVSPTYDGVVSDIKTIANITHKYKIPLIVDEAHGAHFRYGTIFPVSALELGADVVIQSIHKTLPSFTQTALLHVKTRYVDVEKIERYLQIYQSSSPSYLLMAGIENCIRFMERDGVARMKDFGLNLMQMRDRLGGMRHLQLLDHAVVGTCGVYDLDASKLVISTKRTGLTGRQLDQILRERFHLEMELCGADYVTAITSVADTKEGLLRLETALYAVDQELEGELAHHGKIGAFYERVPQVAMSIFEAVNGPWVTVSLKESVGHVSGEYLYIYPPGIPLVVPGEVLQGNMIETILEYKSAGLSVQGAADLELKTIQVVKES